MKFKAVTNSDAPQALIDALDDLRATWEVEVLRDCFDIAPGALGPAEFYVQMTDFAKGHTPFINYSVSGVTLKEGRKFSEALNVIGNVLSQLVQENWSTARKMQIYVVIHASKADGTVSKLIESEVLTVNLDVLKESGGTPPATKA